MKILIFYIYKILYELSALLGLLEAESGHILGIY